MGRPTTHYLSTLLSPSSSPLPSQRKHKQHRSRSSSPPRTARLPPAPSSSPSPRKPQRDAQAGAEYEGENGIGWTDEWFLTKEEWDQHPLNRDSRERSGGRSRARRAAASSDEEEDYIFTRRTPDGPLILVDSRGREMTVAEATRAARARDEQRARRRLRALGAREEEEEAGEEGEESNDTNEPSTITNLSLPPITNSNSNPNTSSSLLPTVAQVLSLTPDVETNTPREAFREIVWDFLTQP
ncbi:hypothetical protein BDY24DRAFT_388626 [Mrakia frigida]|uniref:uncharacterized protein n=1 Tax=Mrakia frigida TaxID=29902 RepID=UPI003FCC26BF